MLVATNGKYHNRRTLRKRQLYQSSYKNKSSAIAEMGDRSHNRHGPKGGGCCPPLAEKSGGFAPTRWNTLTDYFYP